MIPNEPVVMPVAIPEFAPSPPAPQPRDITSLADVRLAVTVVAGTARMTLRQLRQLQEGDLVPLDRSPDATVDIFVNGSRAGRGDVIVVDDSIAARVSEIEVPEGHD